MGTRNARLLDLAYEPILIRDAEDRITYWNAGAERLYGWNRTEVLGRSSHELLQTQFPEPFEHVRELFLEYRQWQGELVHTTRSGERVIVSSRWVMDDDPEAGLLTLETNFDLTALQASKAALQASEHRLRSIFDLSPFGIGIRDESTGRFSMVNRAFTHLTGYPEAELLSVTLDLPASFGEQADSYRTMLTGKLDLYSTELPFTRKDGHEIWLAVTARALDRAGTGQPATTLVLLSDVTARRSAEIELQDLNATLEQRIRERTHDLEESNRDLEAFSYSVSHDLRAPLRAIRGFADALREDYADRLDSRALSYLQEIESGGSRMTQLIDDLLAYSRLGRASIPLSPVLLLDAVQRATTDVHHCEPSIDIPEGLAAKAHRPTLVQVLVNLLTNACKFVRPGTAPQIRICAEKRGSSARLWIEDNGIGIAPEHQGRIFHVFERLHGQETYPGTGIGLAIVRRSMQRMNGEAGVDSELGQGSRFWIELPLAETK